MNPWIKKSIDLANRSAYLDNLFEIYPVEVGSDRTIPEEVKNKIRIAFKNKNHTKLITTLLKLPRFPIDDPYISALRSHSHLFRNNPKTIKRIGNKLLSLGRDTILELSSKPGSATRRLGHTFRYWLPKLKYPFLESKKFKNYKGTAFLSGSDKSLKYFANKELGVKNLRKGIDFVLKKNNKFILGEAKFLTTSGGTQNNQFNSAIDIAKIKKGNIIGVAVLDGIVWFDSNIYMHRFVKKFRRVALSALLLKDFIKNI